MTLVGMGRRPKADCDFEVVRAPIGAALRTLYSDVLREPMPDRMAEVLRQLDQPTRSGQDADKA
jgi:Anti-sigma factor NepR